MRDAARETLFFIALPRGLILQDEINTILGLVGQGELALLRDVATETLIFIALPRGLILQYEIIQSWG